MADGVVLNAGSGGATISTLDDGTFQWPTAVVAYATTVGTPDVLQVVTPSFGLPVAQQGTWSVTASQGGTWTVQPGNTANTTPWLFSLNAGGNTATVTASNALLVDLSATAANATAIKVDGSATTQPVSGTVTANQGGSWTVTANAGSGTFAVSAASLPLPSGAATAAKQPALGTAGTPSSDVITVQGVTSMTALKVDGSGVTQPVSGTVTANQGGTWNVGTVTTLTGITNALPSGSNIIGIVSACAETNTVFNGVTPLTPKFAVITASASGNTQVIASVTSKKLRVLRYQVSANGAVNVKFQSNTTDITGLSYLTQYASAGGAFCPVGLFETAAGEALNINLSGAVAVGGVCTYIEV